jgi:hypothetical protein
MPKWLAEGGILVSFKSTVTEMSFKTTKSVRQVCGQKLSPNPEKSWVRRMGCSRGWAAGALVSPKRKIVEPPSEARSKGFEGVLVKNRAKPSPAIAPAETHNKRNKVIFMA